MKKMIKKIKKKIKKINKNDLKIIVSISLIIIILLSVFSLLIRMSTDYSSVFLKKNTKEIFNVNDLTVNNLKFGSTEKEIKKEFGNPIKERQYEKNIYKYKELKYKKITLTLRENYDDYILVGINTSSRKYKIGRNIRVGKRIKSVMKKFSVKSNTGKYLYGNYTAKSLQQKEITKNIYFGLRTKKQVMYINRDSVVSDITNVAELNIKYKNGKVSNIKWSYDFN